MCSCVSRIRAARVLLVIVSSCASTAFCTDDGAVIEQLFRRRNAPCSPRLHAVGERFRSWASRPGNDGSRLGSAAFRMRCGEPARTNTGKAGGDIRRGEEMRSTLLPLQRGHHRAVVMLFARRALEGMARRREA